MKKVYFENPVNIYDLKKTYTDSVEFISDTASFPLVSGIAYEGSLNKAIKGKLRAKDMKKKVDRLLEVYKRRLFRHWDDHVDQLLHKLSLPTTTVQKGGPGSGCNPEAGTCGRPSTGAQEEQPLVQEARKYSSAEEFITAKFKEVTLKDAMKEAGRITLGTEPTEIKGKTVWAGNSGRNVDQMVQQLEDMTDVKSLAQRAKPEELPQIMQVKERAEKALHNLKMKGDFNNYQEYYKAQLRGAWNASRTQKFEKGGPGSGCTGDNCGRPATGVAEFHEHETEIPEGTLNVQDVRPALRYKGQVFIGTKGGSHASIYDKNENIMSSPVGTQGGRSGDWGHIEQGYVDNQENKNWVSRETLSHEFGTNLSEDLAFYQEHGRIPKRDKHGWLKLHKAEEENKDTNERKTAIAAIVAGLGASLAGTALDYYRQAYLLGKERGISISGQDFRAAVSEEAAKRIQNFSDGNKEYLKGFMENLNNKFNDTIDQEYATKEAEAEAIKRVAAGAEARLALYVTAILGAFAFGMTDGVREGRAEAAPEEDEEGTKEVTGMIWITSHDEGVCEGCDANDGTFFTLEEFEAEYQHNECLTHCRCAEESDFTASPPEHFARSVRIKDLVKGGPGSGCNPDVGTCGRPSTSSKATTSEKGIKSLITENIRPNNTGRTSLKNTFSSFKLPNGLNSKDLNETHNELQNNGATGTLTGKFKILYNPSTDETVVTSWDHEHADAHESLKSKGIIAGDMDTAWSRMEYSKDADKEPILNLDYWHDTDDFDDPKYKNYQDTIWAVVNNKSFPDKALFQTYEIRTRFNQSKTLGEWREMYNINKGGVGSGCNPAVGTCGRPKSAVPKDVYIKSGKGVTKSWLLPEKYNTVPVSENDLHGEFAERHFGSMKEAFKQGLVRKTGPREFQFEHGNNDAIERVERDIEENVKDYHSSTDSRDDYILLDTFETENYNHTGYQISYQELKDNDYKIKDLLNNKNMIKFEKGGPGSGCVGANCGRKPNPESLQLKELRPALNDSGRIFVGKYGQTHGDVYNDHENDFNDEADALPGFVDPKGNFYSRNELHGVTAELVQEQLKRFDEFITLKKGGPGSGCNPEVGTCGRPKGSGTAEESTAISEPTTEETSAPQATQQPIQQPEAVRAPAQTAHNRILQSKFDSFFSPSDMKVGSEKDVQIIREHLPEVMAAYDKETMNEYHTSIPVVSSGDLPKTMDLPFREGFQPKDSASRHAAASAVSKIFDEKRLNDPTTKDKDVMILAGTSGAGKTHTTRTLGAHLENFALVKDTNLNNFESAKRNIGKALSTGHKVQILYVERDPVEAFTDGVFPRSLKAKSKGRLVTIEVHLKNSMARDTIKQVADAYKDNPNVVVRAFSNRTGEDVHAIRLDEIKPLPYTMNEARTKLIGFIKEKYDTGQITQSAYTAFLAKE